MGISVYIPLVVEGLCRAVCPHIERKFVNQEAIATEFALEIDTYVHALLKEPKEDLELAKLLEKLIVKRMTANDKSIKNQHTLKFEQDAAANHENSEAVTTGIFEHVRYCVCMRRTLDASEATRGARIPPKYMIFTIIERVRSHDTFWSFKKHGSYCLAYPHHAKCSDLYSMVRKADLCHDILNDRPVRGFRIYTRSFGAFEEDFGEDDLSRVFSNQSYLVDYANYALDDDVCMDEAAVKGLIVYEPAITSSSPAMPLALTDEESAPASKKRRSSVTITK